MDEIDLELQPTKVITVDAIGKPGERVFYLQGRTDDQVVTLLVEKIHVQTLVLGIEQFMVELGQKIPSLTKTSSEYIESEMSITPPVDPLFRVGDLSMGYDTENDLMVLIAHEDMSSVSEQEKMGVVRFWCTRAQVLALAKWGAEVISRGRPIWPSSGEPILPIDQFSPKNNGHKH